MNTRAREAPKLRGARAPIPHRPAALAAGSAPLRSALLPGSSSSFIYLLDSNLDSKVSARKVQWDGIHRTRATSDFSSANHRYNSDLQRPQRATGFVHLCSSINDCLSVEGFFTGHVCSRTPAKRCALSLTLPGLRAEPQTKSPALCAFQMVGPEVTAPPRPQQDLGSSSNFANQHFRLAGRRKTTSLICQSQSQYHNPMYIDLAVEMG